MAPRIAVIHYSLYGHVEKLAQAQLKGIKRAGGDAIIYRTTRGLSVITPEDLTKYDGFIFGISARFGGLPAQLKTFIDSTGQLWQTEALNGKFAGLFVSTGMSGGGQEVAAIAMMSKLAHHGIICVPIGTKGAVKLMKNMDEVHDSSPWGAGSIAGERMPAELELEIAIIQGDNFWKTPSRVNFEQ